MNEITLSNIGRIITADSRDVAENFGKEHKNVLQTIQNLVAENSAVKSMFIEFNYESRGKEYPCYLMTRDGFTLLGMGFTGPYALHWKLKYIEAFNKMEKALALTLPSTFSEALRLAADQAEKLEEQKRHIAVLEPKAEFFDAVAGSRDAISIGDAAKVLDMGVGQNRLFDVLRREQILQDNNIPYQTYIDRGYFRVVEQKFVAKGETRISIKTLVSQRGLDYIRKMLQKRAVS